MGEITRLLDCAHGGDADAWERVVALLYPELLRMARRVRSANGASTLCATALVHECYLRMASAHGGSIGSRTHFLGVAGRAMRQILANYARDRMAAKRGGGARQVTLDEKDMGVDGEAEELLALDGALGQLAAEDARLVQVVDCRVFAGLTEQETALALDLPLRTVQRLWQRARERLRLLLPG